MRLFLYGAAATAGLFCFMGLTQIGNQYKDENAINREFINIYGFLARPVLRVETSTPTASQMKEGELIFIKSGSAVNIYGLIKGATYNLTLQKG